MARLAQALLIASILTVSHAFASVDDIRASDREIGINFGGQQLKYGETANQFSLDNEHGIMPNFGFDLTYMLKQKKWPTFTNNLYMHFEGQISVGNSTYNGYLQEQVGHIVFLTPITQTNHDQIYEFSGKLGRGFAVSKQVMLIPFVDLGYRSWERDITGVGGYTEKYTNGTGQVGFLAQYSPFAKWVFSLTGEGGSTFGASLHASLNGSDYTLGSTTIWQGTGKIGYAITKSFELSTSLSFKGFGFGASPVAADGSYEPDSYTHETNLRVGMAYLF